MKKILILGSTGMLGNAVSSYFLSLAKDYDVTTTYRTDIPFFNGNYIRFDAAHDSLEQLKGEYDYVINCIGIIKPFMAASPISAIEINSLFPWKLALWCNHNNCKLIHITSDCVYSGNKGKYVESDLHDALDEYGKSKSLGECISQAMVLRTSIIGEELHKYASLISWATSQKGKTVKGFDTHIWNGITTKEYAIICDKIIKEDWFECGLFHIHAADDVTKLQLLQYLNEKYALDMFIETASPTAVDRTLRSEKSLCKKLEIPTVWNMIKML